MQFHKYVIVKKFPILNIVSAEKQMLNQILTKLPLILHPLPWTKLFAFADSPAVFFPWHAIFSTDHIRHLDPGK